MSGPTFQFVAFAIAVALFMSVARTVAWRERIMLVASVIFLATMTTDPVMFIPLIGFLLVGYAALRMPQARAGAMFGVTIAFVLVLFFWIKKYAFVPEGLWLRFPYLTVGVSYMLFRLLHLIIESREQPEYGTLSFREYLAYLIGFNTLIAGPIQDFADYRDAQQDAITRRVSAIDVGRGAERIAVGLFKTNVLAAILVVARQMATSGLNDATSPMSNRLVWGALVFALYPFFLYCNFSGYIDIVIGVSKLFLHRLPENFNRPFSATSFIDFWNRWHITLSRWLRNYVYNPLLLNSLRRFPQRSLEPMWASLSFFVTFFLVGVWHGQTVGFVFFGFLQGLGVAVNKLYQMSMTRRLGRKGFDRVSNGTLYEILARGLTFTWFTFTLTWFWASWSDALAVWSALDASQWLLVWLGILVTSSIALAVWEALRTRVVDRGWARIPAVPSRRLRTVWCTALVVLVGIVTLVASQPAPQIVYKNF